MCLPGLIEGWHVSQRWVSTLISVVARWVSTFLLGPLSALTNTLNRMTELGRPNYVWRLALIRGLARAYPPKPAHARWVLGQMGWTARNGIDVQRCGS